MEMMFLIWSAVLLIALYLFFKQRYSVFARHGIKNNRPIPLLGNMSRIVLKLDHFSDDMNLYYFDFPTERFVGKYEFMKPVVVIRDLELVKKITVKDFDYFLDHRVVVDEVNDPLFGRNLFSMKGQTWKDMRSTLSPAFTSSKIKVMVPFMVEVGEQMNKALMIKIQESGVGYIDIDIKDLTTRYANDVVASCAFGLKVNSLVDLDNQFYTMGKEASSASFRQLMTFIGYTSFPKIMKFFGISFFTKAAQSFFKDLVSSTMQEREARNIIRPDMIHLLMEARKGKLTHDEKEKDVDAGFATVEESTVGKKSINREWSQNDLTAQAVLFFIAGFETIASTMSFLLHELALNPDIQEKLVEEIRQNEIKNKRKFDYNSIQSMTYMDMVVSELLRLWPPAAALDRVCCKDYNMGRVNDKATEDYIIRKGTGISIPVWSFHHDPQFFPDPYKFDPERFSEANKHNINPNIYMPFGLGPRNCIGSRFALCEVKVMVYQLLLEIEVSPCEETCIPTRLSNDSFQLKLRGGHWLRLRERV